MTQKIARPSRARMHMRRTYIRVHKMCLRWGICGAGKISNDFVIGLKGYGSKADHSVVAVGARSVDSAAKFATTHVIERYYGSYEELAKDSEVCIILADSVSPLVILYLVRSDTIIKCAHIIHNVIILLLYSVYHVFESPT